MSIVALSAYHDNYIWVIHNEVDKTFFCVDPGDALPVLSYANKTGLRLNAILVTHHHTDHVGGLEKLHAIYPELTVYAPEDARIPQPYKAVHNNTLLSIGSYQFNVLETPGHTLTHVCYFEPHKHWLFCGDTLFSAGCGRIFEGSSDLLYESLCRLKQLPDDTKIYCAHEYTRQNLRFAASIEPNNPEIRAYATILDAHPHQCSLPSTLNLEKKINPFLRIDHHVLPQDHQTPQEKFRYFRQKKDLFS
jgi:hydroxyacylglutathione hydrolase